MGFQVMKLFAEQRALLLEANGNCGSVSQNLHLFSIFTISELSFSFLRSCVNASRINLDDFLISFLANDFGT